MIRSSGVNIDESNAPLSHSYGAYAEYAASYYSRHPMVLDPESLQLYRSGILGADPTGPAAFRVNEKRKQKVTVNYFENRLCLGAKS